VNALTGESSVYTAILYLYVARCTDLPVQRQQLLYYYSHYYLYTSPAAVDTGSRRIRCVVFCSVISMQCEYDCVD